MESRHRARGPVTLTVEGPLPYEIAGTLLNLSASGFCALYENSDLRRGDRVQFRHRHAEGSAVVIWTRIAGPSVEAGFHITNGD